MPVGWVADSGQRYGGHAYNDALAAASLRGVPVVVPACRQRWVDDEVTFTFLSPCGLQFTEGANDVNENSLVVLVQYGMLRSLFMGDAGFQSEDRLLHQGVDLHADILKVLNARWKVARAGAAAPALDAVLGLFERIHLVPALPYAVDAATLAQRLDHPVYDCLYAVLAKRENGRLATADRRFAAKVAQDSVDVIAL